MLDQITIDRIIDAANIVDVVSEYVSLRRAGANYKGLCPFHEDKTPSFHVSPSKGICKCFACGEGGNAVHFIMKMEQLSYVEALKYLGKKYGIEVEERELTSEQRKAINERESLFAVNEWASNYYADIMQTDVDGRAIGLAYFRSRGFRDDIIQKFRLGFSLDKRSAMSDSALSKGYSEENLVKANLSFRSEQPNARKSLVDKFRGRAMFPWFNVAGKVVAFGGRVLDARTKGVAQKYVNTSETPIYVKGRELYGIFQAKKQIAKEDRVYMVEGYTDVISMHQCGIENVVANSGTALSKAQIVLLHRFTNNITLLYDGDEAGIHAALRGTDMLLAEGMNVKILLLPDGDDPDSFARKHNATEFKQYVEEHQTDFIIFKTNLMLKDAGRDPIKRSDLTKSIVRSISVIPDEIVRSAYVHECAELLRVNEEMLLRETTRNRKAAYEELLKEQEREKMRQQRAEMQALNSGGLAAETEKNDVTHVSPLPQVGTDVTTTDTTASSTTQGLSAVTPQMPPVSSSYDDEREAMDAYYAEMASLDSYQGQSTPASVSKTDNLAPANQNILSGTLSEQSSKFVGLERLIMTLIVRHGEQSISCVDNEGNEVAVPLIRYVNNDFAADGLTFQTPLYASMLANAMAQLSAEGVFPEGFTASNFFMGSPDLNISTEAVNLLSDRYQLSKNNQMPSETELLPDTINHLLLDYKFLVIEEELKKCQQQMNDPLLCADAMRQYMSLSDIQRQIAKRLGDRIFRR